MGHKKEPTNLSVTSSKINTLMLFLQLDLKMNGVYDVILWISPTSPNCHCYTTMWKAKFRKLQQLAQNIC